MNDTDGTNADMPGDDLLDRAAQELREEELPRWADVSTMIKATLRATIRRTWPLDGVYPGDEFRDGDLLQVSDQIVRAAVVAAISVPEVRPDSVDLTVDDHRCIGASIGIIAQYGLDLYELSDRIASLAVGAINEVLGTAVETDTVTVTITDIVLPE